MVVNIGGFLGPPLAHFLCGFSWPMVFYGCAALVSVNLLWLLSYPEVDSGTDKSSNFWGVAVTTARNLLQIRLLIFILIASVFLGGPQSALGYAAQLYRGLGGQRFLGQASPGLPALPEYVQRAATGSGMGDQSQPITDNFPGGAAVLVRQPTDAAAHVYIFRLSDCQSGDLFGRRQQVHLFLPGGHRLLFHR